MYLTMVHGYQEVVSIPLKSGRFVIVQYFEVKLDGSSFNPLKIGSVCNEYDINFKELAAEFQSP